MFILVGESTQAHALLVDDEPELVALVQRGLVEEGYAVDVALTGEEALELLSATRYDVLVLDIALPGINGFDLCRRLREAGIATPILILTALDGAEDKITGLASGANEYLTKPFSFAELLGHLRSLTSTGSPG